MFEKGKPVPHALCDAGSAVERQVFGELRASGIVPAGSYASKEVRGEDSVGARFARGGDALRAIEWSELTARLNAARELRRELREEAIMCAVASGAKFGDAAAGFFNMTGHGERPVNPDGLEASKGSACIPRATECVGSEGDVRED